MTTYKDAISREEAIKIFNENWIDINMWIEKLKALPSLQDQVVELIEKKIESLQNSKIDNPVNAQYCRGMITIYQELLEEIKTIK